MKLYRTAAGCVVEETNQYYSLPGITIDFLLAREDLPEYLSEAIAQSSMLAEFRIADVVAPISHQEVWAAGVTYYRSRGARMEESKDAGGGDFYDRVYSAERPELFFKSTASRTVVRGQSADPRGRALVRPRA